MKKIFLKRTAKVVFLLLSLIIVISMLQTFLFFPHERDVLRLDGFRMEEKDSLDVVLLGASEIYTAFSSSAAYDQEGFTSYPYAIAACPVTLWRTMLEDVLSRQTPQLIVVEMGGVAYTTPGRLHSNSAMHYLLDNMPLSVNKIRAVSRLCNEETDEAHYFILPIMKYHSTWENWQDLIRNYRDVSLQHQRGHTLLRGVSSTPMALPPPDGIRDVTGDYSERDLAEEAGQYLREFLEYCREKDLKVLFTCFPHQIGNSPDNRSYDYFQASNQAERIIREYGFSVLRLDRMSDELGIDPANDYYNEMHLNHHGQKKVTEFLARYLVQECGVKARSQSTAAKAGWEESAVWYPVYLEYLEEKLQTGTKQTSVSENAALVEELTARFS